MNEIKFRGKSVVTNEWIYGKLLTNKRIITISDEEVEQMSCFDMCGYEEEIYPETLGQYTGLKDKNGNDIYEGDIVRRITRGKMRDISQYENEKNFKEYKKYLIEKCKCIFDNDYEFHQNDDYIVEWKLNGWYPFADSPENCGHCGGAECPEDCKVIGNIHDNPELKGDCK